MLAGDLLRPRFSVRSKDPPVRQNRSLPIVQPLSFHILAHSFALSEMPTPLFSCGSALFQKKMGGGRVSVPTPMPEQVIKRRSRGFICLNAHPEGCLRNVERQIAEVAGRINSLPGQSPRNVLVIGAST